MDGFKIKPRNYKGKDFIVMGIYIVTFSFCFFLMFLGIIRIFEVNDYFGNEKYELVKQYCEPAGFFGWGYECDDLQWNKDVGNIPYDWVEPMNRFETNFTIENLSFKGYKLS